MKTIIINQYKAFIKDSTTNIVVDKNEDEYLYNMIVKYSQDPDMTSDDILVHVVSVCGGSYATYYVTVDTIQHEAVTEERVTGYKCECGAEKK